MKKQTNLIFITDDDLDDCEFLTEALKSLGPSGKQICFFGGQELINHLEAHTENLPDLIVLDINMPVLNGFQTLEILKQNSFFQNIPVVMFSASSNLEDEKLSYKLGGSKFLKKPLSYTGYLESANAIYSILENSSNKG